jgi:hypothetical protein
VGRSRNHYCGDGERSDLLQLIPGPRAAARRPQRRSHSADGKLRLQRGRNGYLCAGSQRPARGVGQGLFQGGGKWPGCVAALLRVVVVVSLGLAAPVAAQAAPGHVLFGVYVKYTYGDAAPRRQLLRLERALGRRLALDHVGFYAWKQRLPLRRMKRDLLHGRRPLVEWAQAPSADIVSGSQDARIARAARAIAKLPGRVFLEYAGEMDRLSSSGKPQAFVRAWLHVRAIFEKDGATNARFVWCPTAYAFDHHLAAAYYPGDAAVDWLCADGYNWGASRKTQTWRSFHRIFSTFLHWAAPHPKPILIGEWGSVPGKPGQRAAWIAAAARSVKADAQIKALSYFDTKSWDEATNQPVDWRLNTEKSALDAFKAMANDPYFTKTPHR